MAQGLERIPLAVDSDFKSQPVRANFPDAPAQDFKLVSFEPDQAQTQPAPASMGVGDTLSSLGRNVWDAVVYHTPAAVAAAVEGDDPYATWDWKDALIGRARQRAQEVSKPGDADTKTAIPGITAQDINSLGPSAGFSVAGAAAGLGAGIPAGMVASPVAGYAAGMAASGTTAYRMATNQFVRDLHDTVNAESLKTTGKPVSPQEFQAKQAQLADTIKAYGLWEAVPEAAGNALSFGILTAPVKGAIGKLFGKNIATRFAGKLGALYGEELATETVTQMGQHNAEVDAGMTKAPKREFTSPQDWHESLKEVAGPTMLQTTLMAGGFKAGQMAKDRLMGKADQPDNAIPADDIGAGPGGSGVDGEFIPATPAPALANQPGGTTYDQSRTELPPGQTMLPRLALPAPEDGGPSDRQVSTAIGLLKHSPKASPDLLQRLMRVDQTMATMLFNHWKANGQVTGNQATEIPAAGDQGQGADIAGSRVMDGFSDGAVSFTPGVAAEDAAPSGESGMALGATGRGPDVVTPLDVQAHAAATSPLNARAQPTEAQKQAGNYAKGHVKFHGMDISIENPSGSVRTGTDASGRGWETQMQHHYGYIKGTVGKDKDHLDVFIKPGAQSARTAYVIDQINPKTGAFDEHKIVFGADSEADAQAIYHANYEQGWQGMGAITAMPIEQFKEWIKSGKTKKPVAYTEPKEIRTASRTPKAASSLLQAIVNRGGISREIMSDVGADPAGRYMPGLFTKTGTTDLSALAGYLFDEDGFHQIHQDSPIGPARELEDLIVRAINGERILSTTAMEKGMQAEETAKLKEKAQRLGVKTVARKLEDIAAEVAQIEERNILDEETRLEDEALVAYNEAVDALNAAIGEDATESFLEDLASRYQDETHLNYLRSATIALQEKLNAQVQSAGKPDESAAGQAGPGDEAGRAQGGADSIREEARPTLSLSGQSEAEIRAEQERVAAAEAQRKAEDERAAAAERQARIDAEVAGRQDVAADNFTLTPQVNNKTQQKKADQAEIDRQLAGQGDIFGSNSENQPADPVAESLATAPSEPGDDGVATIQGGTAADTIAGKPVADMSDDQLRTIARGLSPTFGEAAVDKAKTEINRRNAALREAKVAQDARGEVGASLTKEQRKAVMQTLTDVYKTKGAPKESKGIDRNGNERTGYAYSPELFEKSDITGAPIRYVVTLPDGRIAHPTELFPDMTLSKVEALILEQAAKERDKAEQDKFRREQLERRKSDTINEANGKFNRANPGIGLEFVPALLTDGKQFIRTHPDTVANDLRLLGGDWIEKPVGVAADAHNVGDVVKLTKPGVNGRVNIAGTVTKILPDGRLEVRTQQDGYMTVAESELGHKPKVGNGDTTPAASIAGKPVSEMSDGTLSQIAKSSQPAAEKAKAEVARRKKPKADPLAAVREFYTPGNIIHDSYWNTHAKVLEFKDGDLPGQWSVKVQNVKKDGDQWVADKNEPPRWHATAPGKDKIVDRVAMPTEQDRDSFTLERLNGDTMEPVTFKRGEYVRYTLSGNDQFGDIDGISHARREFSVDGLWYPFGFAYKAERPAPAKPKDAVPLSSVVDAANKKHGEGLTEDDRVPQKPAGFIQSHKDLFERLRDGKATLAEYKDGFASILANKDAVMAELGAMTKDKLLEFAGSRYKNDKKDDVIRGAWWGLTSGFQIGRGLTYSMGENAHDNALRALVEKTTQEDLDTFAERVKAQRDEYSSRMKQMVEAAKDPKTLDDFTDFIRMQKADGLTFAEARMKLTPEQRAKYDRLRGIQSRDQRKARADQQKTDVRVSATTTDGQVIETKHTKTGEPLFVVKAAERVERDVYNHWNATAKRLGGWYSSYRGGGAVPGFQFKTRENADAFLAFIGGNAEQAQEAVQARRDAFEDDRSQSAVERLNEMADRLEERADESLGRERKANTERRARFAASAEAAANAEKAMATTMRRIAAAIEGGTAQFLDRVRQKTQIEYLMSVLRTAKDNEARAEDPNNWYTRELNKKPVTAATADYAEFPQYTMMRSDLANLARHMVTLPNMKMLGQRILKVADDTSEAYNKFAKAHLLEVSKFGRADGSGWANFTTLKDAERSIAVSNLDAVAVPLQIKRGEYRIVLSPSEAIKRGIWEGDDRKITLDPDVGAEIVEKLGKLNRASKFNRATADRNPEAPWQFENAYNDRKRLAAMGIEEPWEFRAALREFAGLKETPKERDKIKEMERAMIGRRKDGLDFFPTSAAVVEQMLAAAEIEEGMSVLEPSAGMGHIAQGIRDAGVDPDVVELSGDRRELLEAKGFNVVGNDFMDMSPRGFTYGDVYRTPDGKLGVMRGSGGLGSNQVGIDFLDENGKQDMRRGNWYSREDLTPVEKRGNNSGYDRILMNPPFSDRRDAEHVQHAYTLLRPGGRLVAVVGEGVFFGSDKKAQAFRDWLEEVGATDEKLPEGSFMDPALPVNTGVNARMVVVDKPDAKGMESRASDRDLQFAADVLGELAAEDEAFRWPVSKSASLKTVFSEVYPGSKYFGEHTRADERDESGADHRHVFLNHNGKRFYVYERDDGRAWIDVSALGNGDRGNQIYAAVANWAYNAGKRFQGDPVGVSADATIRRTTAMLSSALRFGTTRHLEAAPEQIKGDPDNGVEPLDWRGSEVEKLRALIHTFITTLYNKFPELNAYHYDFQRGGFFDKSGKPVTQDRFDSGAETEDAKRARAGEGTLRRGVFLKSLVSSESSQRPGLLEIVLSRGHQLIDGGLKQFLSKATPAQAGVSASGHTESTRAIQSIVDKFREQFAGAAALDIRVVRTIADIPERFRPSPFAEGTFNDDAGLIYLVAMNLKHANGQVNAGRVWQVLMHEAVGHAGLAKMMGSRFGGILKEVMRAARAKGEVGEDIYEPGHPDYATVEAVRLRYTTASDEVLAEEVLARMAETDPGRTLFGYVRAVVRQWLRDMARAAGITLDVTTAELNDLVAQASRYMRRGDGVAHGVDVDALGVADMAVGGMASKATGMESRGAPPNPQGPIWSGPEASRADDLIYTMQDKNVDLKRVQQGITKALGDIRDDVDVYLQEELFHGRAAKATEEFLERELQPFVGEMKQRGIDMDTLETFLWARHAKERNAQIAKINPDMPDGGSGLTDRQAADILAGKDVTTGGQMIKGVPQDKLRSLKDLATKIDRMVAGNRILTETYELETPDTVAAWKGAYQHYVPLHREDADSPWAGNGTGQGYSVKGSSTKRATGSFRPVENILANIVLQRTRTITRGEKNRVAQALYGLAKESPNEGFWDTDNAPTIRTVENKAIYHVMDGKTEVANFTRMADAEKKARENPAWFMYQDWGDRVVEKIDPTFRSKPNVVWARFGGEDRFVIFNERDERAMRLAGSLKNLDADDISNALGEVARWTRYFASINTQYNPVFGVINLIRDTGTGLLNLKSTPLEGKQAQLLGNVWQALPAIYKAVRIDRQGGTPTGAWADLWEDFQEAGGKTGYRDMFKNSHEQREALQMALDPTWWQGRWWGKALTVGGVLSVPEQMLVDAKYGGKWIFGLLSDYNTAMENGIRLSAYKLALDEGMTKQRAASLAKNLTVNFNKKGQVARQAGALYAFFNASVQGTARMAETLHHGAKPGELLGAAGKQIVYGGMLLGAVQAMLLMMAAFDDDEPPEFVRDRNIIIPAGGGKYLTVPLPLGFHVLPAIGRIGTEFVLGGFKKPGKHVAHVFDVLADSFNPIGNAGLSMQTLAPTVLDPAAALAENKDWTGKPIFRENMSGIDQKPGHARTKDTATGLSKGLAYVINAASGGTEFKPGMLSPTPDQIDYLIGQVTGGVGRETSKAFQTVSAAFTGEELPTYKIPLVGRFYGDTKGQAAVSGKFYENLKEMNEHQAEFMGLSKSNRSKEAQEYAKENPEAMMFREGDRLQRYISKLRDQKRTMLAKGEPREKIKAVDDQITKTMQGFNQRVDLKKNPQRGMTRVEVAN